MEPITVAFLTALAVKATSTIKYLTSGDARAAASQVIAWACGVAVVVLAAQADIASGLDIGGVPLGSLDFGSQVLAGLGLGSAGSFAYDFKAAVDGTDSAAEPKLGGGV